MQELLASSRSLSRPALPTRSDRAGCDVMSDFDANKLKALQAKAAQLKLGKPFSLSLSPLTSSLHPGAARAAQGRTGTTSLLEEQWRLTHTRTDTRRRRQGSDPEEGRSQAGRSRR